jgi:hypothetical protein
VSLSQLALAQLQYIQYLQVAVLQQYQAVQGGQQGVVLVVVAGSPWEKVLSMTMQAAAGLRWACLGPGQDPLPQDYKGKQWERVSEMMMLSTLHYQLLLLREAAHLASRLGRVLVMRGSLFPLLEVHPRVLDLSISLPVGDSLPVEDTAPAEVSAHQGPQV